MKSGNIPVSSSVANLPPGQNIFSQSFKDIAPCRNDYHLDK